MNTPPVRLSRAVCGGSWLSATQFARVRGLRVTVPKDWDDHIGFRLLRRTA